MLEKSRNILSCLLFFGLLTAGGLWLLFKTPDAYSASERRVLSTKVELNTESIINGKFMSEYETYALDQFPVRDGFRTLKALCEHYVLQKKDSNKLFTAGGYLSKLEYPMNVDMIAHATDRFSFVYEKFMKEKGITPYLVIVPDKNYYLAADNSFLTMDYEAFYKEMLSRTDYMEYIDIRDLLEAGDYYFTDTHWRQECITDVAERILDRMGIGEADHGLPTQQKTLNMPFDGVYVGQAALPVKPDTIQYLDSELLQNCVVTNYDTGKAVEALVYDEVAAGGRDGYDFFLEGPSALITIENPGATTDRELVIFRDSFGSSLAPLLVAPYKKVTLVDIRYIRSDMVGAFVKFDKQDVLFEYSTVLLNNSLGMK